MRRWFLALAIIYSLADTASALPEVERGRTAGISKEPKVGVAAGGWSITGVAKPGWQQAICKKIEERIKGQKLFKKVSEKLEGKQVSCLMTLRSDGEISDLRIASESKWKVSDDAILNLVRTAAPFGEIAPLWSASFSIQLPE